MLEFIVNQNIGRNGKFKISRKNSRQKRRNAKYLEHWQKWKIMKKRKEIKRKLEKMQLIEYWQKWKIMKNRKKSRQK